MTHAVVKRPSLFDVLELYAENKNAHNGPGGLVSLCISLLPGDFNAAY